MIQGKWGLGIGDWGLGIGDWAQSPIPTNLNIFEKIKVVFNYKIKLIKSFYSLYLKF